MATKGSFWVDPEWLELLRLDVIASEIEPGLPMAVAGTRDRADIAGAGLFVTSSGGTLERNVVQFRGCREYGSESAGSFDR